MKLRKAGNIASGGSLAPYYDECANPTQPSLTKLFVSRGSGGAMKKHRDTKTIWDEGRAMNTTTLTPPHQHTTMGDFTQLA